MPTQFTPEHHDDVANIVQAVDLGWDDPDARSYCVGGSAAGTDDEARFLVTWGARAREFLDAAGVAYADRGLRATGPGW